MVVVILVVIPVVIVVVVRQASLSSSKCRCSSVQTLCRHASETKHGAEGSRKSGGSGWLVGRNYTKQHMIPF
jgi:hypothetical protein